MKKLLLLGIVLLLLPVVNAAIDVSHQDIMSRYATNSSGSINANVDASVTEQVFSLAPPNGEVWYVARMFFTVEDNAAFRADQYGGLTALTNGYYLRTNISGTLYNITPEPLQTIKKVVDMASFSYDLNYQDFGAGNNYVQVRWTFTKAGSWIKLNGSNSDSIDIVLRDDLTGLVGHYFLFQGFVLNESRIDKLPGDNMNTTTAFGISFSSLIFVFTALLVLGVISFVYFRNPAAKAMSIGFISLTLLYLLRFVGWFVEIVNPDQTELIATLSHLYGFSVYILKGVIYICVAIALYFGVKSLKDSSKKKSAMGDFERL